MFGIENNVQDFFYNSMKSWKLELNVSGGHLEEVDIRREIFQGDSLSPLFFALRMVPLTWFLRRATLATNRATKDSDRIICCIWMT